MKITTTQATEMMQLFQSKGREALYADHYKLAESGEFQAYEWREFLLLPQTNEYIKTEMEIIRKTAMNEILADSGDSTSVGKAQLLNALVKYEEDNSGKEGPIFIYTYVPLNREQEKAENTRQEREDIFKKQDRSPFE